MSTRRARIKAVASLPVRRKNTDNDDKKKQVQEKTETVLNLTTSDTGSEQSVIENISTHGVFESNVSEIENLSKERTDHIPEDISCNTEPVSNVKKSGSALSIDSEERNIPSEPLKSTVATSTIINKNTPDNQLSLISETRKQNKVPTPKVSEKVLNKTPVLFKSNNVFTSPLPTSPRGSVIRVDNLIYRPITPQKPVVHCTILENEELNTHTVNRKSTTPKEVADYNPPSVPESIGDDVVMDGIVPLQAHRSAPNPKPIDLLKNEIISENAEVLFDPIVPLPSPSKVRPKLRPVPRLGPFRRNSIQGSASESEDEARRFLLNSAASTPGPTRQRTESHSSQLREANRIRNDSISSSVSQAQPPVPASPQVKDRLSKHRRRELSRRLMRRRHESLRRDQLTMYDLIFCNPTENPIIPDEDELKAKEANLKEAQNPTIDLEEEDPDDPPSEAAPVPQIKLGPNGEIVLDEKSLVIKQTQSDRKVSSVVREGAWGGGGGKYTRGPKTADWSAAETVRFYRALAAIGTDFSLMASLFPGRSRKDIKLKFKKEERLNCGQVDMALRSATQWDATDLANEFREERESEEAEAKKKHEQFLQQKKDAKERAKAIKGLRVKNSRAAKLLAYSTVPDEPMPAVEQMNTADQFIQQEIEDRIQIKKLKALAKISPGKNTPPRNINAKVGIPLTGHVMPTPRRQAMPTPRPQVLPSPRPQVLQMPCLQVSTPIRTIVPTANIPSNIESGSLVVLAVRDPKSPMKQTLQTFMSHGNGRLTPIALPTGLLSSVVGYVNKTASSPLVSPLSSSSQDRSTPGVIQINPSPAKRQRHSSYTMTQL